jgi:hypothetical protein
MCVAGKRSAPPEDCGGPSAFMANRRYYAGARRGSLADLDDFADEFDDEDAEGPDDYDLAGLKAGRARGRNGGRPKKLSPKELKTIRTLLRSNEVPTSRRSSS